MEAVPTSQTDIKGYGGVETHLGEAAITRLPATLFYDINPELVNALTTVQLLAQHKRTTLHCKRSFLHPKRTTLQEGQVVVLELGVLSSTTIWV
jgi:hypothetical protein